MQSDMSGNNIQTFTDANYPGGSYAKAVDDKVTNQIFQKLNDVVAFLRMLTHMVCFSENFTICTILTSSSRTVKS